MPIVSKGNKGGSVVLKYVTTANDDISTMNVVGETVNSATITDVFWSANNNATWVVDRGVDNVLNLSGSGSWHLADHGLKVESNTTEEQGNVAVTLVGTNPGGSLILKLHKKSSFDTEY
tara:strand:- start:11012 stop:11368 length:357 start_codon:yes stop_codon:yes gene_type:complete